MNPLISVVIPVYKVEDYLCRCIDSVLYQSYQNIEIILVDDGSPDSCPQMCDDYARKDNRIKVIHKENGGLSDARNKGINLSSGEYILFLDSDDYWECADFLSHIVYAIQERHADVILYGCKDFYVESNKLLISRSDYDLDFIHHHSSEQIIGYLFGYGLFPGAAWLVAVKRQLVVSERIYFIRGIKGEDFDWLMNLFLHVKSIDAVNDSFYVYVKGRKDSITGTSDIKSIQSLLFTIDKWEHILLNRNSILSDCFRGHLAFIYATALIVYSYLEKPKRQQIYSEMESRKHILKYARDNKVKFVRLFVRLFGIGMSAKLLKLYRR